MRRLTGRHPTSLTAALLIVAPAMAQAAEPPCLTAGEFTALANYSMPSIISGTSQRCAATLAPDAYLRKNGSDLATRYARQKPGNWPGAKSAFLKLSSTAGSDAGTLMRDMPDSSLQPMLDAMMEGMVAQQIPLERCGAIDKAVRLLAPLPPENSAELIALAVGLGARSKHAKIGKFSICPG